MVKTCVKYLEFSLRSLKEEYERIVSLQNFWDTESRRALEEIKKEMLEIEEGIKLLKNL